MPHPLNRRQFVQTSLAAAAGVAALSPAPADARRDGGATQRPSPLAAGHRPAEAMILIWLGGGVCATDTFDPKPHTPFRPGMRASDLRGTCPSIPTAIDGVRFGEGLERLAAVMDRGAVVRTVTSDLPHADEHAPARNALLTGITAGDKNRPSPGPPGPGIAPPTTPTNTNDNASHRFIEVVLHAPRRIDQGARLVHIDHPFSAYAGFDTHEHGAARMMRMKRDIDAPIAAMVLQLENRGLLDTTLVVVASEFGRTIQCNPARGQDYVIRHERDYGLHAHHRGAWSVLLFGGPVRRGVAFGRTSDAHPIRPIENPLPVPRLREMILHATRPHD